MGALTRKTKDRQRATAREGRASGLDPSEVRAHEKWVAEAEEAGAMLKHATLGDGGLAPSLVLGIMRRDEYRCKRCSLRQDLEVHHKDGAKNLVGPKLRAKKHASTANNLVTLCGACHDAIHTEDRAAEE